MIRTVDSDVVVIAVYAYSRIADSNELWIDFGVGRNRKYIPIHDIDRRIPSSIVSCLPFLHAFMGCDTVSAWCDIGKHTAWNVWMTIRDVNDVFESLSNKSE